jgi:hypothetical protein
MKRLHGCDGLIAIAVAEIEARTAKPPALRKSSKIARALDDLSHVRSALVSIAYDFAAGESE